MTRLIISCTFILALSALASCQKTGGRDLLFAFTDPATETCGFKNAKGEVVIRPGKYTMCFTDTLRSYAIVFEPEVGMLAIDKKGQLLYEVYPFDNGPDYPSEGLFRIIQDGKIGYADAATGSITIRPQYDCAFPFENGTAKVALGCTSAFDGEHSTPKGGTWFFIDRTGKSIAPAPDDGRD